ncbi:hypothetical protein BDZ91DRAFT_758614 [Kalaharituber pfeilii]|nr:hypothetical protein BDZ91DRAFT_758614 [Kalaharituber pfeilii]
MPAVNAISISPNLSTLCEEDISRFSSRAGYEVLVDTGTAVTELVVIVPVPRGSAGGFAVLQLSSGTPQSTHNNTSVSLLYINSSRIPPLAFSRPVSSRLRNTFQTMAADQLTTFRLPPVKNFKKEIEEQSQKQRVRAGNFLLPLPKREVRAQQFRFQDASAPIQRVLDLYDTYYKRKTGETSQKSREISAAAFKPDYFTLAEAAPKTCYAASGFQLSKARDLTGQFVNWPSGTLN